MERLSVDFPPLPDGGNTDTVVIVVEDDNTTVVTAAPTTQAPSSKKRFTLFNSDAYGLNALVSSAASRLVQETRDGYAYNSELYYNHIAHSNQKPLPLKAKSLTVHFKERT